MNEPTLADLRETFVRRNPRSLARHVASVAAGCAPASLGTVPFPLVAVAGDGALIISLDGDVYRPGPHTEGDAGRMLALLADRIWPADLPTTR